jgi:RimJ/RimL family protein N-acetyltransferase
MTCFHLHSDRLLLRPPEAGDVPFIVPLADDYDVAKNLSTMPHPYCEADAQSWIARVSGEDQATGKNFVFAITRKPDGGFIGACGLHLRGNGLFEFGYWLGKPFWGRGYATEAARRLVAFAFKELKAERVWAGWFHDNPASGRVLAKLGCKPDGRDQRSCLARGHDVLCNLVILSREDFFDRRSVA